MSEFTKENIDEFRMYRNNMPSWIKGHSRYDKIPTKLFEDALDEITSLRAELERVKAESLQFHITENSLKQRSISYVIEGISYGEETFLTLELLTGLEDRMAQLRYPTNNYYRRIEATIRKDFAKLPDNHGVGYDTTMFKMAGERHTFDTHGGGSQYSYRGIDCDWFWDIAWLENIVVLEESSNEEEEDML